MKNINNESKIANENIAIVTAIQAKYKFGKSSNIIMNWLMSESCSIEKNESPDFIIKKSSGVIGVEHFQISASSVKKKGALQSLPNELFSVLKDKNRNYKQETKDNLMKQALSTNNYHNSIQAFKIIFEDHLLKVKKYRENLSNYENVKIVFLIEMLFWDFVGLTAVGENTFNCDFNNIPMCKDIIDIISNANEINAVVI